MSIKDEEDEPRDYASPACFMHEVDPAYMGLAPSGHSRPWITGWRKGERQRLIDARRNLSAADREARTGRIRAALDSVLEDIAGKSVSVYWPFRGEPDLRGWMTSLNDRRAVCLLPIVTEKGKPLTFRSWRRGEKLGRGVWDIPIPVDGEEMTPDIVIAPLVGFDDACFRLGYGGGFFDRTLAARNPRPLTVGVGFALQYIPTIHPLEHDIPMDIIVTENQVRFRKDIDGSSSELPQDSRYGLDK